MNSGPKTAAKPVSARVKTYGLVHASRRWVNLRFVAMLPQRSNWKSTNLCA
jgi:hypothetical protein